MKLLAIFLTLALFGVMGWLIVDSRNKTTALHNELELLRRQQNPEVARERDLEIAKLESQLIAQQQDQGTAAPAPAATAASPGAPAGTTTAMGAGGNITFPADTLATPPPTTPAPAPEPPPLSARQRQVQAAPALAKVTAAHAEYGFVEFSAGSNNKIENGMMFAIRRDAAIVGRIKVTSVEDASSTIADVIGGSVPAGVTIQAGDDVIQDLPPVY